MQRRNFIKNTILATGALTLPLAGNELYAGSSAITSPAVTNFRKAIMWGSISMRDSSVNDICKVIKAAGFAGVEPRSQMDRKEVIDAMKSNGLIVSSVCWSGKRSVSSPDATARQEWVEETIIALEDAHAYGTDAILLVPGSVNENVAYDECWNRSVEGIKKVLPTAKKLKVQICVENVWNNFLLSPMEAARYVDQFKSPYVKFYFDCGNYCHIGWPEQWIRILGNRIGRIHIKEYSRQVAAGNARNGFNVKLGEGDINWTKVLAEASKVYQGGWLVTEQGSSRSLEDMKDLNERFDKILRS